MYVAPLKPYFGLRSYQDAGVHYDGQIGSEATPAEFLDALLAATREMVRVLKPSGSIFVNLGDKYNSASNAVGYKSDRTGTPYVKGSGRRPYGNAAPHKSLMGIPWRYAIQCIDQLGLILRAEIIWAKPNGLPESVTDRVRRSHEQWFHFTKSPRYFSAVDEIREAHNDKNLPDGPKGRGGIYAPDYKPNTQAWQDGGKGFVRTHNTYNPLGKLPGSVWTIPSQPLTVPPELGIDHFAAYPMEWPRRIIQGWTPNGICTMCGEGRRPVTLTEQQQTQETNNLTDKWNRSLDQTQVKVRSPIRTQSVATITGYMCGCPTPNAPTTPAVCLDPFGGTGTTALVAKALGRTGITIDLSADYCRLAEWRCNDPRELAAALQVEKPDPVHPDQLDLFSGIE